MRFIQTNLSRTIFSVSPSYRNLVLAIAITESNCRYDIKHPDSLTCGIGGIKPIFWAELLGDTKVNSLKAIELVIRHLVEKHNGSIYEAIKEYKGGNRNLRSTNKCFAVYKEMKI